MFKVYYLRRLGMFELSSWFYLCYVDNIASLMEWAQVEELTKVDSNIYQCESGVYYKIIKDVE